MLIIKEDLKYWKAKWEAGACNRHASNYMNKNMMIHVCLLYVTIKRAPILYVTYLLQSCPICSGRTTVLMAICLLHS